jgi:thiol-disulfide isomerase/thioredoxin
MRSRVVVPVVLLIALVATGPAAVGAEIASLADPVSGEEVTVRSGGLLHLVFFATWCPPCLEEFPGLADLEARWQDDGYDLVLVAVPTRQTTERLRELIASRRPPGRVLFDATGTVTADLMVRDVPTHILLDAEGREIARAGALEDGVVQRIRETLGR